MTISQASSAHAHFPAELTQLALAAAAMCLQQPSVAWAWVALFALVDGAAFQGFLAEGLQRTPAGETQGMSMHC